MKLYNTNHGIKLFVSAENRTFDLSDYSRGDLPLSHEASSKTLVTFNNLLCFSFHHSRLRLAHVKSMIDFMLETIIK